MRNSRTIEQLKKKKYLQINNTKIEFRHKKERFRFKEFSTLENHEELGMIIFMKINYFLRNNLIKTCDIYNPNFNTLYQTEESDLISIISNRNSQNRPWDTKMSLCQ